MIHPKSSGAPEPRLGRSIVPHLAMLAEDGLRKMARCLKSDGAWRENDGDFVIHSVS